MGQAWIFELSAVKADMTEDCREMSLRPQAHPVIPVGIEQCLLVETFVSNNEKARKYVIGYRGEQTTPQPALIGSFV